jgi:acyl dehydratase
MEVARRYFEDIDIGDKSCSVGRTITETDIVNFAGLSGDFNLIHTDKEYAQNSIAGQRIAHGLLVQAIASGLFTRTVYNHSLSETLLAMTEITNWKFKKTVVIGDTIHVEVEITEKSDTRPEAGGGKVVMRRTIYNQRGEGVQAGDYILLIKKNPDRR